MKVEVQPRKTQQEWSEPGFPSRTDCGLATPIVTSCSVKRPPVILEPSRFKGRFWLWFTAFSLTLILMAATRWIFDHP
jgi:hypothetical protein